MLLAKTFSLPQIKVNLDKYDNFFTKKSSRDAPLDGPDPQTIETEAAVIMDRRKKAHSKNLQIIDRKSTIRSKVESFLTDSRKMGILDHNTNQTSNRRSLTRISLEAMKPLHTSSEQLRRYLTHLKKELNEFFQKNQQIEHEIKNSEAMTSQVKEKIIFYEQLAQKTWIHRYELLDQRHQNLEYIRYETDRLKFMQQRLKDINIIMRKRVKDAQNAVKNAENQANIMNEIEGIRQDDLDNKIYLLKHYEEFQHAKCENLGYKTDKAIRNMQENEAAAILKRHHGSITIMQPEEYRIEQQRNEHMKLAKELAANKLYQKLLDATWTRCSTYYQQYQKAEQLIKMHAIDRQAIVQDSYKRSFEIKKDVQQKILVNEKRVGELEERNKKLKEQFSLCNFEEIEEIERRIAQIKLQYKTGKNLLKEKDTKYHRMNAKSIIARQEQIQRAKAAMARMREWIKGKEKTFILVISKKQPLHDHFNLFIQEVFKELKQNQATYVLKPAERVKKPVPKVNKYGNSKKRE